MSRPAAAAPVRQTKYRNKKTELDGNTFDSKAEAKRYFMLKGRQSVGEISGLELQPRFPIVVAGVKVCTYVADFRYLDTRSGETVVEDVKGVKTAVYSLKRKLMKAVHGIEITEVMR